MRRRSRSIRFHLAIFGALIVLPLVAAGLLCAKLYLDKERAAQDAQAERIVADATTAIERELERYKLALQVLASSTFLADGKLESFYLRAQTLSESIPGSSIALRRANGETVFLTTQPFGEPLDKATDPGLQAADRLAIQHRSPVITDLINDGYRSNLVALEIPMVNEGRVDLLTLGLPSQSILNILTSRILDSEWLLLVTDNDGRIIARSRDNEMFVGQKADAFINDMKSNAGNVVADTPEGERLLIAWRRSEASGWRVSAALPLSSLDAPVYQSLLPVAIIAGIALLGSLLLAFFYARRISRPLRQIQGAAEARGKKEAAPIGIAELDGVAGTLMRSIVVLNDRDRAKSRVAIELNQRMRNVLSIIRAIATQTRRRATSLEQFGRAFDSRLTALAKSHEALGEPDWHGGDLASLIAQCCRPFGNEAQLQLHGPPIEVPVKASVAFGMVFHELASNAAKYGAFSTSNGVVKVQWDLPEEGGLRILRLQWQEQHGPIIQSARKEGFGTFLLPSIIEDDLGGKLDMIFTRDGLHLIACIPVSTIMGPPIVPRAGDVETAAARR